VVKGNGLYKILDSSNKPNTVGWEILDRVASNNLTGARVLLDWIRKVQHVAGGDDPLTGQAFPRMWTIGKEGDARQMKLAAAAILCQSKETAPDGVAILEPAFAEAAGDTEKLNISLALLEGYSTLDAFEKKYVLASELAKNHSDSKRLFEDRESALRGLGRFAEVNTLANEWLKKDPSDLSAMRALVSADADAGNYTQAVEQARKIRATSKSEPLDYNELAWLSLYTGKTDSSGVEAATKAVQESKSDPGTLHTLGCVYAEVGKTKEAREVLIQAMDLLHLDKPDDNYWYAFGRIAEQYGETQSAMSDYQSVTTPKKPMQIPSCSYKLAQMRLAVINGHAATSAK
jgi:tetratricopeptide (TPR) repeat protein